MPPAARVAVVTAVILLTAGCASGGGTEPTARPTPYDRLHASSMHLARVPFCSLVDRTAARDALGGQRGQGREWRDGDETSIDPASTAAAPGTQERVQELGCSWQSDSAAARAWVFARPVDTSLADQIGATAQSKDCRVSPDRIFGRSAYTQVCQHDGTTRVRHAGLFSQTWLSCEVEAQDSTVGDIRRRADAWCVSVANDLDTGQG